MRPLLRDGDLVHVQPAQVNAAAGLKTGTLILFVRNGQLIVHRFLRLEGENLLERGDCSADVGRVAPSDLLGVVMNRKRRETIRSVRRTPFWRLEVLAARILERT